MILSPIPEHLCITVAKVLQGLKLRFPYLWTHLSRGVQNLAFPSTELVARLIAASSPLLTIHAGSVLRVAGESTWKVTKMAAEMKCKYKALSLVSIPVFLMSGCTSSVH